MGTKIQKIQKVQKKTNKLNFCLQAVRGFKNIFAMQMVVNPRNIQDRVTGPADPQLMGRAKGGAQKYKFGIIRHAYEAG